MATIVLVVANPGSLSAGDIVLRDRLIAAGHTVVPVDDGAGEYGGSYDGVVVSDSSSGGTVGSKYDTVAKPGVTLENVQWRLGSYLGGQNTDRLDVYDVEGNGGLVGTIVILPDASYSIQGIDTDTLPGTPTVVARLTGDADHGVIVTWPEGSALTSGTAPGKRVFCRLGDAAVADLNEDGLTLLDGVFAWAFGGGGSSGPPPRLFLPF